LEVDNDYEMSVIVCIAEDVSSLIEELIEHELKKGEKPVVISNRDELKNRAVELGADIRDVKDVEEIPPHQVLIIDASTTHITGKFDGKVWIVSDGRSKLESVEAIHFILDSEGYFTHVGGQIEGVDVREGMHITDILRDSPENRVQLENRIKMLEEEGVATTTLMLKGDEPRWVEVREEGVWRGKELVETVGVMRDITDLILLEREMEEFDNRLVDISTRAGSVIYRMNILTAQYDYISPSIETLTGFSLEEHMRDPKLLEKLIHPEDRGVDNGTYRLIKKDGSVRWVRESRRVVRSSSGVPCAVEVILTDVTELMDVQDKIGKETEDIRRAIETANVFVVVIDEMGRIEFMNSEARKLTGYDGKGRLFDEFVSEKDKKKFRAFIRNPRRTDISIISASGKERVLHVGGMKTGDKFYLVGLDLTEKLGLLEEHARKRRELEEMYKKLKEISNIRTEFMNMAVHDLKNPIIALKGNLELIKSKELDDEVKRRIENMEEIIDALSILVNDLRDAVKLESQRLKVDRVDLSSVLHSAVNMLQGAAFEKGLNVKTIIPSPLVVEGDEDRLLRLFVNLIGNAIKYTDKGTVGIEAVEEDEHIHVKVWDTGRGIQDVDKIFEKFYGEGMGLGLYIAKKVVEAHSGRIYAESTVGKGSVFHVLLPKHK